MLAKLKNNSYMFFVFLYSEMAHASLEGSLNKAMKDLQKLGFIWGCITLVWVGFKYQNGEEDAFIHFKKNLYGIALIVGAPTFVKYVMRWF